MPRRSVSVLVFDGMSPFETGIVVEVFGLERPELGVPWYDLAVCRERPGPVRTVGGMSLQAPYGLERFAEADTLIVPGWPADREVPPALLHALQSAHTRGARVVSICSGAFALAAAGLLDGRRATTHWRYAELLRRRYPRVQVDADVLYVDEGQVLTSAGSAAGLDLCLHLVRQDHGAAFANAVARRLVVSPHRAGGQAQFVEAPVPAAQDDDRVAASMAWALEHLSEPITLGTLAAQAVMSSRSYSRHFAAATGTTPVRWLIAQRLQSGLALLETTSLSVEQVAREVGIDSAVTFRAHFRRAYATSPSAYRVAFRTGTGTGQAAARSA
jgi:AraC family transcriptional activator FtrA